jgi:hypothetical protein
MEILEIGCDVKGCKNRGASSYSIFSHRASDAAGSMENWHHVFDLCPSCSMKLLRKFISMVKPEGAIDILTGMNIESRIG